MKKKTAAVIFLIMISLLWQGCQSEKETTVKKGNGTRDNTPTILIPQPDQTVTIGNDKIVFDLSHQNDGYVMVKYSGNNPKVKVRIQNPGSEELYTYDIHEYYNTFPLTGGNGTYTFSAFENVEGTKYSQLFLQQENISIDNDYIPFLYPNQYVNFNENTKAIELAKTVVADADDDLDAVAYVYEYVIDHLEYDDDKATQAKNGEIAGYLPDVDDILNQGKGICFDYAAVMATMLRTQNIPTRMEIGYANFSDGAVYHAWISVYIKDVGWIDDLIQFDGKNWSMMDPTLISDSHNSQKMRDFIKEKTNYTTKYLY